MAAKREVIPDVFQKISGKWKLDILYCLAEGEMRRNALAGRLPDAAPNVLTRQLRKLEQAGLLRRCMKNDRPPYVVSYALTEEGKRLIPMLRALSQWEGVFSRKRAG